MFPIQCLIHFRLLPMRIRFRLNIFWKKEDDYFDGEIRTIPVYPLGLEKNKRQFFMCWIKILHFIFRLTQL